MHFSKFLPMALIFIGLISGVPARAQMGLETWPDEGESWFGRSGKEIQADFEARQKVILERREEDQRRKQLKEQGEQLKLTQEKQNELEQKLKDLETQKSQSQQASQKADAFEPVYAAYKLENGQKSGNEDSVLGPCEYVQDAAIGNGFSVPTGCDKSNFQVRSVTCKSLAGKVTFISTCKVDGAEISANRCADQYMAPLVKKDIDKKMNSSKKTKGAS